MIRTTGGILKIQLIVILLSIMSMSSTENSIITSDSQSIMRFRVFFCNNWLMSSNRVVVALFLNDNDGRGQN